MNEKQKAIADLDQTLGHLLVQVDTFYQSLPEPVRKAYDALGSGLKFGCHCDLEEGMEPDGCVIDEGLLRNCVYAKPNMVKEQCEYWKPIKLKR